MLFSRFLSSRFTAALLAVVALLMSAGAAAAHIGLQPAEAPPNTNTVFTARVPNEQDSPTVRVRIEFPAGVTVSRFQPKPGWQRADEKDGSGRITAATWTGGQIGVGEFDDFVFQARTPAEAGTVRFRSFQTYGNGNTVEWINPTDPGLAPSINVRAAAANTTATGDHGQAAAPATGGAPAATAAATSALGATAAATAAAGSAANAAAAATRAAGAGSAAAGAQTGSDLPLFVALGSGAIALLSLALAAMALMRRPAEAGGTSTTVSGRAA